MSCCFRNVTGGASGVAWKRCCEFAVSCMGGRLRVYVLGDMRCNRFAVHCSKDAGGGENWLHQSGKKRSALGVALVLFNIIMMIIAVVSSAAFSVRVRTERQDAKISEFVSTIESMKKLSQTYLDGERGYVRNWASYISEQGMTLEGALQFLRSINTDPTRYVHIVDMETFRAYSSFYAPGQEEIDTYARFSRASTDYEKGLIRTMQSFFDGTDEGFNVVGMYRTEESMSNAVSVGTRVTIQTDAGATDFLLLRVIPVAVLRSSWVFPVEYPSAEVGVINRNGDYVIQSTSMKSRTFVDYIRAYNFQDDYNKMYTLLEEIKQNDSDILRYKNFRGEDCLWYYSSFSDNSDLRILGVVAEDDLKTSFYWTIVLLISGTLLLLMAVDGLYLFAINRRLKKAAEQAEQASLAKTQFLSAMSHDIRTPMNIVQGMTSIALHNVNDPQYAAQCLEKSMKAERQLLTLINDVLDISKIESGKLVLNPTDFSLEEMVGSMVEVLMPAMQEKDILFSLEMGRLPHRFIRTDQMRLNQVYSNLLSNAIKYTNAGGKISMELHQEPVPQQPEKTRLICRIQDNGIGMTPEYQQVMYDSFSRAVDTQVNRTQGTGLGLAIVKQVVDALGGSIQCKSAPGAGTTFLVSLDVLIVEEDSVNSPLRDDSPQQLRGMKLLAAEDNDLNWEILSAILEEYGILCQRVSNGQECVRLFSTAPAGTFDGILMDVHMPVMDGLEATKAIRALPDSALHWIPIIAMTADAFAEDVQKCMECGMNGHVAKPVDINKLLGLLKQIKRNEL